MKKYGVVYGARVHVIDMDENENEKDGSVLYNVVVYEDYDCEDISEIECAAVGSVLIYTIN